MLSEEALYFRSNSQTGIMFETVSCTWLFTRICRNAGDKGRFVSLFRDAFSILRPPIMWGKRAGFGESGSISDIHINIRNSLPK